MSVSLAIAGKPNSGKSTLFKALTLANVEIANYPFTTIDANHGVAYVRVKCPCTETGRRCGKCIDGERFLPIKVIDVAGLVPDAHLGRGLGNEFLDHISRTNAIIHVIDASGGTDMEGNVVPVGSHNPLDDVEFLEHEITMWIYGILSRKWNQMSRKIKAENLKVEVEIAGQLMGAGVEEEHVRIAIHDAQLDGGAQHKWTDEDLQKLCDHMRRASKPILIAANKMDAAPKENIENLQKLDYLVTPISAEAEMALRMAANAKLVEYLPGNGDFKIISEELSDKQARALEKIGSVMHQWGGTGVQKLLNGAVFNLLGQIAVYPVENESKWEDKNGNMLPDAYLVNRGCTTHDLAYKVHTEIGDSFLHAIDGRSKRRLGEKHELREGDVIKIVSTR